MSGKREYDCASTSDGSGRLFGWVPAVAAANTDRSNTHARAFMHRPPQRLPTVVG
jgi:hypothetical protein